MVKAKKENFSWYNYYEPGTNKYVTIDGYYADTPKDAQKPKLLLSADSGMIKMAEPLFINTILNI